jgi:hypothetical protein
MTKEQAIEKLNDNFGSIYSKEDVINLLNSINAPQQTEIKLDEELINRIIDSTISKTCTYYMDTLPDNYEVDSNRIDDIDVRAYGTEINIESVYIDLSSVFRDAVATDYKHIRESVKDEIDIELGLTKDEEQDENN